jgi:SAM-dependent methyltransferase
MLTADNFIEIPFTYDNLDRYLVRCAIKKALDENLHRFSGKLLDVGCGKMPYKNYIKCNSTITDYVGLDIETAIPYDVNIKPDYTWDGVSMPFEMESFDTCMATEVLEHCPAPEVFLNEIFRVLKPGGVFFFTVPFLWNLHEIPHDEYRYTPFSLERHLKKSGFKHIEIKATGGWHASMAQMLGLWVKRSSMNSRKRNWAMKVVKPIMKKLIKMEANTPIKFQEGQMITGLYGIVRK